MRLKTAHVRNYRSIRDTGVFDVEFGKTILVGPNEAGKTAILQALQQIRAPKGIKGFDALRDYPRALYNDITVGKVKPEDVPVSTVTFELDDNDRAELPEALRGVGYTYTRYLDNNGTHALLGAPPLPTFGTIKNDLVRLAAHIDGRTPVAEGAVPSTAHADKLAKLIENWRDAYRLTTSLRLVADGQYLKHRAIEKKRIENMKKLIAAYRAINH